METLLVTGGAGFIGSNFIRYMLDNRDCHILNLDLLTYAGNLQNLAFAENNPRYTFVKGDIRDRELLRGLFERYSIGGVVNFAAESHVDRSIVSPDIFLETNILGTQALMDVAMHEWKTEPDNKYSREYRAGTRFLQISTDEVYGALGENGLFREDTPLSPNSPYSASKAGADLLVRAYHETYGLPVLNTRCSNNYGPYQFPEKLIPLIINNCFNNVSLPVYGDGLQVRDWIYVEDHCRAIDAVLSKGRIGGIYNVGGNSEKTNISLIRYLLKALGKGEELITYVSDRPGHDRRYAIDNRKITSELGWSPEYTFEEGMAMTIRWYLGNTDWMANVTSGAYRNYYDSMYSAAPRE